MKPTLRTPLFLLLSLVLPLAGLLLWPAAATAQDLFSSAAPENLLSNGGFEAEKPAYWAADGTGALWSSAQARTPGRSLALSGNAAATWTQDEAVRNWVPRIIGNQEILVGGYVRTDGVNTNPASDADKFQLVFEFFNASGTDLLGEPLVLDVPQDQATSGEWVEISNLQVAPLVLPENATSVRITFRKGASATGTAYLDDLFVRNAGEGGDWPGGFFNTNVDAGDTWYYWWDGFDTGNADWPDAQPFIQTVTTEAAHTGQQSLKIEQHDPNASESVAISERVPVTVGEPVLVSFWVKTEGVLHPDSIGTADYNIGLTALWYEQLESGAAGYGEIGGLDIRLNGDYNPNVIPLAPRVASSDWTQYAFVVYPREGAVAMELRLRYWHHFEGVTYWDDVFIAPVSAVRNDVLNLLSNGGFEAEKPAYWAADGTGALWSSAQARTPGRSLALSGNAAATWTQDEAVRNWVPRIIGNQEILVGGYVRTDGVNTNPASDADKFQLVFEFFNASGTDLLGEPLVLDVPQDQATSGEWVEISNLQVAPLVLPENATSVRITFRKGASATGTAYLDDLFVRNAGEGGDWPGGFFNTNVDAGDTWYYWWDGFDTGNADWPDAQPFIQTVTTEAAHTGQQSLKIEQHDPNASESVAISERVPVTVGEPVLVSFWVKTEGVLHPDSIGTADYNIGLTALWYEQLESGAAGYGEIGGLDIRLNGDYNPNVIPLAPRVASSDWTQYAFVVYPREGAVAMELRLRYWHHFEGVTYWDDVFIGSLGGNTLISTAIEDIAGNDELPGAYRLHANYPNPFNPATMLSFTIGQPQEVTLEVFNVLGQRVATLLQSALVSAGRHEVAFDAARLPSGTYLYVLKTSHGVEARTMVLVK